MSQRNRSNQPISKQPVKNTLSVEGKTTQRLSTAIQTLMASAIGTGTLVVLHHQYRKRRQPTAQLPDYLVGLRARWQSLRAPLSKSSITKSSVATSTSAPLTAPPTAPLTEPLSTVSPSTYMPDAGYNRRQHPRPVCWVSGVAAMPKQAPVRSGCAAHSSDDDQGAIDSYPQRTSYLHDPTDSHDFGVVGIDAERQLVWLTTMPERVHDIVVQPPRPQQRVSNLINRDVVVMGRRPSERFWVLSAATGQVRQTIEAGSDRHYYGHACYSLDGSQLYVTENDTINLIGKVGIYDAQDNYQKIAEFDTHGIGPHELVMHPDGETLVIANGGIKTEQASREELNLDCMQPSLVYLQRHNGTVLEQVQPAHNQMSVRHLAIHDDGTVMIGIQFQGPMHLNVPLVLTHQRGDSALRALHMPNDRWHAFHQYIASVAVDAEHNLLCVTSPIGGCAAVYDLQTRDLIDIVTLPDCAGAAVLPPKLSPHTACDAAASYQPGFIVSDGQGQLTRLQVQLAADGAHDRPHDSTPDRASDGAHDIAYDTVAEDAALTASTTATASLTEQQKIASSQQQGQHASVLSIVVDHQRQAMSFDNHLQVVA